MSNDATNLGKATCIRETDKAILVEFANGDETWIPKSQIHDDSEVYDSRIHSSGKLVVKTWFAEKNGLV